MCGRITRTSPREAIAKEFGVTRFVEVDWHPRYHVAPSQIVEAIISVNGEKSLGPMRWGFVSPTAKEPKIAPTNARAETPFTSPMFRNQNPACSSEMTSTSSAAPSGSVAGEE
jgi:putative SOS response-associated peptidase YedK